MKKLALALIASTVALSATQANIGTGFYAGGAVGYGMASGVYGINQFPPPGLLGTSEFGGNSGNIGIHGGYGWVDNSLYFGGELAYTFDNSRVNNTMNLGLFNNPALGPNGGTSLKRNGYFNIAARAGYLVTRDTMFYIRLGSNLSKWTLRDAGNFAAPPFGSSFVGNGSVNRLSFVPGFGIETAFNKNLYLRGEYTYEFGPSVIATNPFINGSTVIRHIRTQSGKIGLSYRFLPGNDAVTAVTSSTPESKIDTGYYLGSAVGYGGLTGKYSQRGLSIAGNDIPGFGDSSGSSGNIGIHGGYGMIHNCVYAGGEVAYTFDNAQINNTVAVQPNSGNGGTQLKRHGYFNMAVRGGYLVTPATMLYLRLGANWGKWTFQDAGNNFNNFSQTIVGFGSKNRMTFVPGLGLETALHKNIYLRAEYTYEYCPTISAFNVATDGYTSFSNLRQQSGKLGLSYKF
jgi:opacity protein-like surface antigen